MAALPAVAAGSDASRSRRVLVLLLSLRLAAAFQAAPLRLLRQSAFHPAAEVARLSTIVAGGESDDIEARSPRRGRAASQPRGMARARALSFSRRRLSR